MAKKKLKKLLFIFSDSDRMVEMKNEVDLGTH